MSIKEYLNKVTLADCMEAVNKIPNKSIDIIITDPPYMLKKHYQGNRLYSFKGHLKRIDDTFGSNFDPTLFLNAWFPKTKNGIIAWCSTLQLPLYINYAIAHKYKWEMMVWCKSNGMPNGFQHLRCDIEYCVRMYKKGAYFNNNLTNDEYSRWFVAGTNSRYDHPCVKPLSLMERQIKLFTKEGDIVCDPFAGTGTTCVAAKKLGRKYIGFEKIESYHDIAIDRIERMVGQTTIFDSAVRVNNEELIINNEQYGVVPAEISKTAWIPACAGMTDRGADNGN